MEFSAKITELVCQLNNLKDSEVSLKLANTELEGKIIRLKEHVIEKDSIIE